MVERDRFEPEVPLAVLSTAHSETPVPPKSATVILAQETGARSPCAVGAGEPAVADEVHHRDQRELSDLAHCVPRGAGKYHQFLRSSAKIAPIEETRSTPGHRWFEPDIGPA